MRRCWFGALLVCGLVLAGCASKPHTYVQPDPVTNSEIDAMMYGPPPKSGPPVRHAAPVMRYPAPVYVPAKHAYVAAAPAYVAIEPSGYTLDSGDKLRIVVFGQDTLSNTYVVDAAGLVTMPLIGAVKARGLTTQQLASSVAGRLKANYLRDPSVAIEVDTYRPFFVLGEVTYPGQYPYVPNITVEAAIAIAGGFTPRASKDTVKVTRKGMPVRIKLPMSSPILPGDTITVGERWF